MKLSQFLGKSKLVDLAIAAVTKTISSAGEAVVVLTLKTPIPHVIGSQSITDEGSNQRLRVEAYDVETVKLHESTFETAEDAFDLKDDGTGTCKSDELILDVAKSTGDVWLRPKGDTLANMGRATRQNRQRERTGNILARIKERTGTDNVAANAAPEGPVVATKS